MVKTEKYKEAVIRLTQLSNHINRDIGAYQSHYLTADYTFSVELTNGTLTLPLHLAADFNKESSFQTSEHLLKAAASFKPRNKKSRPYKKIVAEWIKLFSNKNTSPN